MVRFVAFLRAINVGGRTVRMSDLRAIFESMSLTQVQTFIASGNVIFESRSRDAGALEKRIAARLEQSLGFDVATFVRTDVEVAAIAGHRPFSPADLQSAVALNVALLGVPPSSHARRAITALSTDIDQLHVHGREVYWLSRRRQSESNVSNAVLERLVGGPATTRGLRTMARLAASIAGAGR